MEQLRPRPDNPRLGSRDFNPLRHGAKVVAAVAAVAGAQPLARCLGERQQLVVRQLGSGAINGGCGPGGVGLRLVANGVQPSEPGFQRRVCGVRDAVLDRFVEPVELGLGLGRALAQLDQVLPPAADVIFPAVEHVAQERRQPARVEQALFDVLGDGGVQLLHRHGDAAAAARPCRALVEQV